MQERVTAQNSDEFDIVVQFGKDLDMIGIGLDNHGGQLHMLDKIYGDRNTMIQIGRIFSERVQGQTVPNFSTISTNEEVAYHEKLGRAILDSVGGSKATDGFWTWLTRPAANRLIRLVRKARDESFGRDE